MIVAWDRKEMTESLLISLGKTLEQLQHTQQNIMTKITHDRTISNILHSDSKNKLYPHTAVHGSFHSMSWDPNQTSITELHY